MLADKNAKPGARKQNRGPFWVFCGRAPIAGTVDDYYRYINSTNFQWIFKRGLLFPTRSDLSHYHSISLLLTCPPLLEPRFVLITHCLIQLSLTRTGHQEPPSDELPHAPHPAHMDRHRRAMAQSATLTDSPTTKSWGCEGRIETVPETQWRKLSQKSSIGLVRE